MDFKIFKFEVDNEIRMTEVDGKPYFVAKDVANALKYINVSKAIADHVDYEDKIYIGKLNNVSLVSLNLGQRGGWIINESGLYSLILSSKLPSAVKFKRWVTNEVLPSIRKNGKYEALEQENERLLLQITKTQPMIDFCNAYDATDNDILVHEMAHRITQAGYPIGEKTFFEWLRTNGYLCKGIASYNQPTQTALKKGLFRERYTIVGTVNRFWSNHTPKITPKGQKYFLEKFMKKMYLMC